MRRATDQSPRHTAEGSEHLSLTERGRNAFQQAEGEKFSNPTAAAAYYLIASKNFIAAAEMVDQKEAKISLAYLGKTMLANAAFCSSLQGHVLPLHSSRHAPPAVQDEAEALDSPTSLRTRIDVVDRGRISGTQKIPKRIADGKNTSERSRLECLEELEKELMFIGVMQTSVKGRSGVSNSNPSTGKAANQYSAYSSVAGGGGTGTQINAPARRSDRNSETLLRALSNSPNRGERKRIVEANAATAGAGVLGGAAQQVLGTVNKLLQWDRIQGGYSWDPRKKFSYYTGGDPPGGDPSQSISQPWEVLGGADDVGAGSTVAGAEDLQFDPFQSMNLHYSKTDGQTAASSTARMPPPPGGDDSYKRLLESMSRLSHENMDLQRRLHELSDLDLKCSEINHAIRKYKEKYDSLVSNLPAYKDETDIAYLKSKIRELELKNSKTESKLSASQEQNRALEEANKKLTRTTSKYKSDIRRIALILTQQEEIITKYEAASLAGEIIVVNHPADNPQADRPPPSGGTKSSGAPPKVPLSHPVRVSQSNLSASKGSQNNTNHGTSNKRPAPIGQAPAPTPGSMSGRLAAPPLSPAASTFANLRKSGAGR